MKIKPIYKEKEMNQEELRKLVLKMTANKLAPKTLKENYEDDDLGFYSGGFNTDEFQGDAMKAAMADMGDDFVPLGKSTFEKELSPEEFIADLQRQNLNLPKDKAELGDIDRMMARKKSHEKKFGAGSMNEDFEEGPQPGDMEYHIEKPNSNTGLSSFGDIDWKMIHEILLNNTEYSQSSKVVDNPNFIDLNVNDFTDRYEGLMSEADLNLLYNQDIIYIHNSVPIIEDDKYLNFNLFLDAVKQVWNKFDNINENNNLNHIDEFNFDMKSIYHYFKDAFYSLHDLDPSEAAQILEATFKRDYPNLKKHLSEKLGENSKINRPKDAEGQPLTLKARVKDLETGSIGRVIRFGSDDTGKLTVHVEWMASDFGQPIPSLTKYPNEILVDDKNRIVKEEEIDESMIQSHANGKGQNIKPGNYPQILKRLELQENFQLDNDSLSLWWEDLHPLDRVEIGRKYFPEKHYSELTKDDIQSIFDKEQGNEIAENLENATNDDEEVFLVVDNDFNRAHYKDLVGKTFSDAPGYAQVKVINKGTTEIPAGSVESDFHNAIQVPKAVEEDFDYAGEEVAHNDMENHLEAQNLIGKKIIISNMDSIQEMLFPNHRRIKSILDGLKEEIENMRIYNNTVSATDNMDTDWIFDISNVDDKNIYLEFTGTAK